MLAKKESARDGENYTLFNQKVTFEFLKSHLWSAADILRGSLDASEYRQSVMTTLFLKRLNDTFEEEAEKLLKQGKNEKEAYGKTNCDTTSLYQKRLGGQYSRKLQKILEKKSTAFAVLLNGRIPTLTVC